MKLFVSQNRIISFTAFILQVAVIYLVSSCSGKYYSVEDFGSVPKIDAHYHISSVRNMSLEQAEKDNFRIFAINTNSEGCEIVEKVHGIQKALKKSFPEKFAFATTFCLDGWDDPGWDKKTVGWLEKCLNDGAVAVKVWKNIGMEFRDRDSVLIRIDDPKFDPVFKYLSEKGIPLVGHLGEPKNCWMPVTQMTTKNDSAYFSRNPMYHMYIHPDFPSHEEQLAARDRMLEKNPRLRFIGCHLASLEWSVDELARFFDRFPNAAVDLAARMGQLFYQTRENREKVRAFFINYQDRLIYGTDMGDNGNGDTDFQKTMHETWVRDWEYLVSDHKMNSSLINGAFIGLKLPAKVIDKIYFRNAETWYSRPFGRKE